MVVHGCRNSSFLQAIPSIGLSELAGCKILTISRESLGARDRSGAWSHGVDPPLVASQLRLDKVFGLVAR